MWVLELEVRGSSTQRPVRYGLVPGKTYIVGRAQEANIRGQSDTSMSKTHAKLMVMSREGQPRSEVLVDDLGSKFGTHLNEGLLSFEEQKIKGFDKPIRALTKTVTLKENDRIRFGVMFSVFRLKWVVFNVTTSMMKDKASLVESLQQIQPGAKIQPSLTKTTTHLVMSSISLSMKVVNALSLCIPLVLPSYFRDLLNSLSSQQALPHPSEYIPAVTTSESESQLRDPNINFGVNKDRGTIFQGKVFVFENAKQKLMNEEAVVNAGGKAVLAEGQSVTEETLDENFVLIQPPSTASLASQPNKEFSKLVKVSEKKGWQPSLQNHIYLAVVHCSVQTFCNPNRSNVTKAFPAKTPTPLKVVNKVRAPETQDNSAADTFVTEEYQMSGTTRVLETPASGSKPSASCSRSMEASASVSGRSSNVLSSTSGLSSNMVIVPEISSKTKNGVKIKDEFKTPKAKIETPRDVSIVLDDSETEEWQATVPTTVKSWDDSVGRKRGRESDEEKEVAPKKTFKLDVPDSAPKKITKLDAPNAVPKKIAKLDVLEADSQDKSFWSDDDDDETLTQVANMVEKTQKENRDVNSAAAFDDSADKDMFEFTCPAKTVSKNKVEPQKKDSQKSDAKKANRGPSKVIDDEDEDIFGFDSQAPKNKPNTQTQSKPTQSDSKKTKPSLFLSQNEDDDELFGFVGATKTQKSTKTQETKDNSKVAAFTKQDSDDIFEFQSTGRSQVSKKRPVESAAVDSPAKRPKLTQEQDDKKDSLVKVEQEEKQASETTLGGKDFNTAKQPFNTSGFVGKGNTTVKSEVKQEEEGAEGVSELSRSLCKMTVMGLMRPTTPKPLYVPDKSNLGKPVKNFKKFRKQDVGRIDKRVVLIKYSPTKHDKTSGIEQWFEQNKDLSRRLEEQDEQEKLTQDFWNFNEQKNRSRFGTKGRR